MSFDDPEAVARYAQNPPRMVPGFADLQRMAGLLLAEAAPADGRILVVGAGGGLELKAFAEARPGWTFDGVDPAAEMLALAGRTLGPLAPRAALHHGEIDVAPAGPFDGAACLLTFHFVTAAERARIAAEVRRRLKPSAAFVVAHLSFPPAERRRWLARYAAFANSHGNQVDAETTDRAMAERLTILDPAEDQAILRAAGFPDAEAFYAGFAFRGWVGHAG